MLPPSIHPPTPSHHTTIDTNPITPTQPAPSHHTNYPTGAEDWFRRLPVVTKCYLVSALLCTLLSHFGLVNGYLFIWDLDAIKRFQARVCLGVVQSKRGGVTFEKGFVCVRVCVCGEGVSYCLRPCDFDGQYAM